MFVDIALQFILATVIGSIWAAPFVVTPAARKTLDKEALKFFFKVFIFPTKSFFNSIFSSVFRYILFF